MRPGPTRDVTSQWLAFALLASFGCSTVVPARPPLSRSRLTEINHMLRESGNAAVTYAPPAGEPVKVVASEVEVTSDKVKWVRRGQRVEAPIESVRKLTVCEPGCTSRGLVEGAALGLVAGLALGGVLVATCKPSPSGTLGNTCPFLLLVPPIFTVPLGALLGSRGHPTTVDFQRP